MEHDTDDRKRIIDAFFRSHEEVFPLDEDVRAQLREEKMEKLVGDADALLAYGPSIDTICSIIERDMRKRPGLKMTSPSTIRFCVRSIEKLAKIGGSFGKRPTQEPVDMGKIAGEMSLGDRRKINGKVSAYGFDSLTIEERWRWHAYMRAWRETMGMSHDPPFDISGQWLEPTLLQIARDLFRMNRRGGPKETYVRPPPARPDEVRPNFRQIRAPDLTEAERAIVIPEIEAMSKAAQEYLRTFLNKNRAVITKAAAADDVSPEYKPPQGSVQRHTLKRESDPAVQAALREMEDDPLKT